MSSSINPKSNRDLNQGIMQLWFVLLAWTGDELSHGQAQNGVKFYFEIKFDLEGQGQSPPKQQGSQPRSFTPMVQIWWS